MKNLTLVSTVLAALVVTGPMRLPVLADEVYNQSVIASLQDNPSNAANIIEDAIITICAGASPCADQEAANELLAVAIDTIGTDSPLITQVLTVATTAGMDANSVTSIAVASGVDATVASESTAAGSVDNSTTTDNTSDTDTDTDTDTTAYTSNTTNTSNVTNTGTGTGSGSGGGGGGKSTNQ